MGPRLTGAAGQKRPPPQPELIPRFARSSIQAAAKALAGTSEKTVPVAAGGAYAAPRLDRSRKIAICARLIAEPGQ